MRGLSARVCLKHRVQARRFAIPIRTPYPKPPLRHFSFRPPSVFNTFHIRPSHAPTPNPPLRFAFRALS